MTQPNQYSHTRYGKRLGVRSTPAPPISIDPLYPPVASYSSLNSLQNLMIPTYLLSNYQLTLRTINTLHTGFPPLSPTHGDALNKYQSSLWSLPISRLGHRSIPVNLQDLAPNLELATTLLQPEIPRLPIGRRKGFVLERSFFGGVRRISPTKYHIKGHAGVMSRLRLPDVREDHLRWLGQVRLHSRRLP